MPTLFLRRYQNAVELFGRGAGADSPSLQQGLQGSALPRLVLAGQAGAAARRVHSTRLPLLEGARHAAAAARLPHPFCAVLRQRLALEKRPGVARLASDNRPHGGAESGERSQRGGETKHTETGHSADEAGHKGTVCELSRRLKGTLCDTASRLAFSICIFFYANFSFYTGEKKRANKSHPPPPYE